MDDYLYRDFKEKNSGKKIVILYGNCHATAFRKLLEQYPPFIEQYAIFPIKAIQDVREASYFRQDCFSDCDVLIHQSIQKNNRYGEEFASESVLKRLKKGCEIISVPNVYHLPLCFFPQYIGKDEFKNRKGFTIFFRDEIVDDAYSAGLSVDEIAKRYLSPSTYSAERLEQLFDLFMSKIRRREVDWDVKVESFICSNVTNHRLFYDPNHPTNFFVLYVVKEILKLLGVEIDENTLERANPFLLDTFEMPICESVYQHWGMRFERKKIRTSGIGLYNNLDLEEYIRKYSSLEWHNKEIDYSKRVSSFASWMKYNLEYRLREIF